MKTNRFTSLVAAAFGLAAVSSAGCAEKANEAAALSPANEAATTTVTPAEAGSGTSAPVVANANLDVASAQWADIKDCTYDMRTQFFAGLMRLEAKVDRQIGELTAKRAAMDGTAETKDWDFAMEEMKNARSYLTSMRDELNKATAETWVPIREKVGQAWERTQNAYAKVKSSTTS